MASTVFALSNRSDEFRRVDYLLKLSLRTAAVHDVAVWHFSNPHQGARFEDRTQGLEVLHAWVDADQIETSLDTLATRGFVFGANGQVFVTGTLPFDPLDDRPRRLILCQIGVGRSFVQDETVGLGGDAMKRLPEGYDSIFLARPTTTSEDSPDAVYRHEYVLFDPSQALPMYLVQYVPGASDASDRSKRLLEWPGSSSASTLVAAPSTSPAVEALYDRYDFFDPVWYVPVSVRDKMVGSHSVGEASSHKLIGIGDAYDAALNESLKPDPLLVQRQNEIKAQLRAIDAKLRDVNRNSAEIEERIYKALQDALFQLQDMTQRKMSALLSEEVELRRQLQHVEWIETFLDRQRDEAEPVHFLNAWKCHVQLRGDLCRTPIRTNEILSTVHADLELEGAVRVISVLESNNADQQPKMLTNKPSSSSSSKVKRKLSATTTTESPSRRGSGSMTITGTSSSPQQQQDVSAILPPPVLPPNKPSSMTEANPDLDVSRAFVEALKLQKDAMARESTMVDPSTGSRMMTGGGQFEVPPTPPSLRKPKTKPIMRGPEAFAQYSLSNEANRKCKSLNALPDPKQCFVGSRLISQALPPPQPAPAPSEEGKQEEAPQPVHLLSDAQILFAALPIPALRGKTTLLYATWNVDVPSIQALVQSMPRRQVEQGEGEEAKMVEVPEYIQTVLLIKANGRVFGGYASDPWRDDGQPFGTARSFLFSLDNDVKVPFVGKETLPVSKMMQDFYRSRGLPVPKFSVLESDLHKIQFGVGDLVLANNFREGSSELEHSFGVGLNTENGEAESFLAGAPRFMCEHVELWAVLM